GPGGCREGRRGLTPSNGPAPSPPGGRVSPLFVDPRAPGACGGRRASWWRGPATAADGRLPGRPTARCACLAGGVPAPWRPPLRMAGFGLLVEFALDLQAGTAGRVFGS